MAAKKGRKTTAREPRRNYVVNVFATRPHRIDGTPTPSFTTTVQNSRTAQRLMKSEALKLGTVGAYGEVRLPEDGNKLYAQGEVKAPATDGGKPKFTVDTEL